MRHQQARGRRHPVWTGLALTGTLTSVLAACASSAAVPQGAQVTVPIARPMPDAKFAAFLTDFRVQALAEGIQPQTYDSAMTGLEPIPRVETLNAEQPEFTRPVWAYLDSILSDQRIATGRTRLSDNINMLTGIESNTGVPKEILVALWGTKSNYGSIIGTFNMFGALSTLAYDGPRMTFARGELINAFKILEREHYAPAQMVSSWAGAFGQT